MDAIHYEAYLYDVFDERQAQCKWQNVLEFIDWLKRKGTKAEPAARIAKRPATTTPTVSATPARTCSG